MEIQRVKKNTEQQQNKLFHQEHLTQRRLTERHKTGINYMMKLVQADMALENRPMIKF